MTETDQHEARRREIVARLVHGGVDQEDFDVEFWRSVPPEQRVTPEDFATPDVVFQKG